jgi:hypothetical protein
MGVGCTAKLYCIIIDLWIHFRRRLWEEVYAVEYRRYEEADAAAAAGMDTAAATALALATSLSDTAEAEETSALNIPAWARPLAPLLSASAAAPCKVPIEDKLEDVLVLLRLMEVGVSLMSH